MIERLLMVRHVPWILWTIIRYSAPLLIVLAVALVAGVAIGGHAGKSYVVIPRSQVPGFTFEQDGFTYQVRPIKATRTLYWDGKADSVYKYLMEISDQKK